MPLLSEFIDEKHDELIYAEQRQNGYATGTIKDLAEAITHARSIELSAIHSQIQIQKKRLQELLE